MKIGVSSYSFSQYRKATGCDLSEVCRLAKEIGFDAIEFAGVDGEDPVAQAKELRAFCASLDLPITDYAIGANLFADDPDAEVAALCRQVDVAEALGVPLMRHDLTWKLPEGMTWYEAIGLLAPRIRRVTAYAKERGIMTCSENHGRIFQDPERMETLISKVGDPNYGWLVDVGNFLCTDADPLDSVRRAAPFAKHVHVKDFLYRKKRPGVTPPEGFFGTRAGNYLRGTVVGHGDVPVEECLRILLEAGYRGVISVEFEGAEENLPALRMGLAYLRRVSEAIDRT